MDPQQELFSALLLELKKQYPDGVYDTFLPPEGTPYPFIYLADSDLNDRANKTAVFGTVSQTIHVWHDNPRQRGTVSQMLLQIKQVCRHLEHTGNFISVIRRDWGFLRKIRTRYNISIPPVTECAVILSLA